MFNYNYMIFKNGKEYKQYELSTRARDMDEGQRGERGKSQAK